MDGPKAQYVESVVEKDGKTVFAGKLETAKKEFKNAQMMDLAGKTMLPGFIDSHSHFLFAIQMAAQPRRAYYHIIQCQSSKLEGSFILFASIALFYLCKRQYS